MLFFFYKFCCINSYLYIIKVEDIKTVKNENSK